MRGRIVNIEKEDISYETVVSGISGPNQYRYDNSPRYHGSNGTYATDISTEHHVNMKFVVYGDTPEENETVTVDIRDDILMANGMKRISNNLLQYVIDNNVGRKVNIACRNGEYYIPAEELNLKRQ